MLASLIKALPISKSFNCPPLNTAASLSHMCDKPTMAKTSKACSAVFVSSFIQNLFDKRFGEVFARVVLLSNHHVFKNSELLKYCRNLECPRKPKFEYLVRRKAQ